MAQRAIVSACFPSADTLARELRCVADGRLRAPELQGSFGYERPPAASPALVGAAPLEGVTDSVLHMGLSSSHGETLRSV